MCSFEIHVKLPHGLSRERCEGIRRAVVSLLELWGLGGRDQDAAADDEERDVRLVAAARRAH